MKLTTKKKEKLIEDYDVMISDATAKLGELMDLREWLLKQ